jgi:hypothetical protein
MAFGFFLETKGERYVMDCNIYQQVNKLSRWRIFRIENHKPLSIKQGCCFLFIFLTVIFCVFNVGIPSKMFKNEHLT